MKLYEIQITIVKRQLFNDKKLDVVSKFMIVLEIPFLPSMMTPAAFKEGTWSADRSAAKFLGLSSGYWSVNAKGDSTLQIDLADERDLDAINFIPRLYSGEAFYKGMPTTSLEGILKFPLSLGETGTGSTFGVSPYSKVGSSANNYNNLVWKVMNRGF